MCAAIAIKESAHVGDQAQRRLTRGVDDLGKWVRLLARCQGMVSTEPVGLGTVYRCYSMDPLVACTPVHKE